jgi:chromatin remodeling complex protein RSC6
MYVYYVFMYVYYVFMYIDAKATPDDKPPRAPNPNAFGGPVTLGAPLKKFLGASELPRTEVTKLMWKYIKEKDLQNPANRKEIVCDVKLKSLFKVDSFTMFQRASHHKPVCPPPPPSYLSAVQYSGSLASHLTNSSDGSLSLFCCVVLCCVDGSC